MSEFRLFETCRKIEMKNVELYRFFSRLHENNPRLSALWEKTAQEEENHAKQFHLALKMKKTAVTGLNVSIEKAEAALAKVEGILRMAKISKPGAREALELAVELEEFYIQFHVNVVAEFSDPSYRQLFDAMMAADHDHVQELKEALKSVS